MALGGSRQSVSLIEGDISTFKPGSIGFEAQWIIWSLCRSELPAYLRRPRRRLAISEISSLQSAIHQVSRAAFWKAVHYAAPLTLPGKTTPPCRWFHTGWPNAEDTVSEGWVGNVIRFHSAWVWSKVWSQKCDCDFIVFVLKCFDHQDTWSCCVWNNLFFNCHCYFFSSHLNTKPCRQQLWNSVLVPDKELQNTVWRSGLPVVGIFLYSDHECVHQCWRVIVHQSDYLLFY